MKQYKCPLIIVMFYAACNLSAQNFASLDSVGTLRKIAFGSCNSQAMPQGIWNSIEETKPDIWIWLGDNIYANTTNVQKMAKLYQAQLHKKNYAEFITKTSIIGTWDDHDFGYDNAWASNPIKKQSKKLFLKFINEPSNSERWNRSGVYTSYTFGNGDSLVKIYLLDTRYNKTDPHGGSKAYLLGNEQWNWLKNELKTSKAKINIICNGTQVLSNRKHGENWRQFPRIMHRLQKTLKKYKVPGVIFLSGDIHCAEFLKDTSKVWPYTMYEFTSSGLTHAHWSPGIYTNDFRAGVLFCKRNFGLIQIDWQKPISIRYEIRNFCGVMVDGITVYLKDLQFLD